MKQKAVFPNIAKDMYQEQMKWTIWYLAFVLFAQIAHIILVYYYIYDDSTVRGFLTFLFDSAKVYMMVIGVISVYSFLSYYVGQGVTRKDYFKGSVLAALGLTVTIILLSTVFTYLQYGALEMFQLSHLLSDEFLDGNRWDLMIHYLLSIFIYYLSGYLVGIGFYRYHWIAGLGFIAFFLLSVSALEWSLKYSFGLSVVSSMIVIAVFLTLLRQFTKSIAVKL